MSNNVQIVLIIAAALIIVLFIFRRQLRYFRFTGGKEGVDMQIKTRKETGTTASAQPEKKSTGTSVSGNKLWGRKNKIAVGTAKASVDDNQLIGENQEINVGLGTKKGK